MSNSTVDFSSLLTRSKIWGNIGIARKEENRMDPKLLLHLFQKEKKKKKKGPETVYTV